MTMTMQPDILSQLLEDERARHEAEKHEAQFYVSVISAKAERDRASYAAFRKLDDQRWRESVKSAAAKRLADAREVLKDSLEYVAETDPADVLARFRAAEDRFIDAAENVRKCEAAVTRAKQAGNADKVSAALAKLQGAKDWAAELEASMEQARAEKDSARETHDEARHDLEEAHRQLAGAEAFASTPITGEAPVSMTTIRHCGHFMAADEKTWNGLSWEDQNRVRMTTRNSGR